MSEGFVGEIRMFAGNFAPAGWMFCDGQLLPIAENEVLFQVIGTTYGGDGESTFGLPDLRSRVPIHQGTAPSGSTYQTGQNGGVESVTLTANQIPIHNHAMVTTATNQQLSPEGAFFATATSSQAGVFAYSDAAPDTNLIAGTFSIVGGSQPHDNIQPSLAINFIISLFGIFPSPT